jgi:DNA-directed RNA polymerase specialized sigma24 family protein
MFREIQISPEKFEKMLLWLGEDRDDGGRKYEEIRSSLIDVFIWRGCDEAEELADVVMSRVIQRVEKVSARYTGDPTRYFYGVARKVLREHHRWQKKHTSLPDTVKGDLIAPPSDDMLEKLDEYLAKCIQALKEGDGDLILGYYSGEKRVKIGNRRELASSAGLASNTLRVRVHRIRNTLEQCIRECLRAKK